MLPSLNGLRAFDAAARHLSFKTAAEELFVTPAAVSQQIKQLEEFLGVQLFVRKTRELLLSDAGRRLQPKLRTGFQNIQAAVDDVLAYESSGSLHVDTSPAFAGKWLIPRLDRFHAAHPEIDLRVVADMRFTDFSLGEVDCAIRFGAGSYKGLVSIKLMEEEFFPVCSPVLLEKGPPLITPNDLRHHNLLHDVTVMSGDFAVPDWRMWLTAAGADQVDPSKGDRLSPWNSVSIACVAGQGVAIGRRQLVADDLKAGRLVRLFDVSIPTPFAHWLVYPRDHERRPRVQAFRDWICAEASAL